MNKNFDLKWLFTISNEITDNFGFSSYRSIVICFFAQITNMLSLLLPIKVVMLLGTTLQENALTKYFNKEELIILLVILSVLFFLMTFLLNKLTQKLSERDIKKNCPEPPATHSGKNHTEINIYTIYLKLIECFAGLLFTVLALITILFLYFEIGLLLISSIIITYIYCINAQPSISMSKFTNLCLATTNIVFFLVFISIVIDFLYFSPPTFFTGLGVLILSRLLLGKCTYCITNLNTLCRQKQHIDKALNAAFNPTAQKYAEQQENIWDVLKQNSWIDLLVQKITNAENTTYTINYLPLTLKGVFFIRIDLEKQQKKLLIKLFDHNFNFLAKKEAELLQNMGLQSSISPKLLKSETIFGFYYNLFDISNCIEITHEESINFKPSFYINLLKITPNQSLITNYKQPPLWERFNSDFLENLSLFLNSNEKNIITPIIAQLPKLINILKQQPLKLYIPYRNNLTFISENKTPISLHWSDWDIEPLGYGINLKEFSDKQLNSITNKHNFEIVFVVSEIENLFNTNNFQNLSDLLSLLNKKLTSHQD